MVTNVTSLTGNGLKDWLIQRATAVYLLVYTLAFLGYFVMHPFDATHWHMLWSCQVFQALTIIAVLAINLHAWIGIWTVTTDYLTCTMLRVSVQMLVVFWLLAQLVWCIMMVWGR